ncbi:hypothetical protein GV828_11160 [Flavobacterium sp. NST-5]|uniref:Glutaminyl-tRNA synthetase n=1 Tax=Flavobacterium ichthyis TaxID=2698827 RepID=A0ABW9ZB10_9FLAO|nr:DUF6327 family protein [Flavobacterium ichthyis]NBL65759.1 hypothetical protein [Flavobacterium ichthyis]
MEVKKIYTSFEEINRDLEILKVEKELAHEKLKLSFEDTKDSITAKNILGTVPGTAVNVLGALSGPIKNLGVTYLFKKIFKL